MQGLEGGRGSVPAGNTEPFTLRLLPHSIGLRQTTEIIFHFELSSGKSVIFFQCLKASNAN